MDDKIKYLRLLVDDKLVYGEMAMTNEIVWSGYRVSLKVQKDIPGKILDTQIKHESLKLGETYFLGLTKDRENISLGNFVYEGGRLDTEDKDIIFLDFYIRLQDN